MNKVQKSQHHTETTIIGVTQHQNGLEINMVNSYEQQRRTTVMIDNIRKSHVLIMNKEIRNLLTHQDVVASDLTLNK